MVVSERTGSPATHVLHLGGDFTRKGDHVAPGVPHVLPRLVNSEPGDASDRLDLARWLVDRRNPLTARVAVNRIWQAYFGRGPGRDRERLRHPGLAPQPSRVARLAGLRADGSRLERKGDPPPDRDARRHTGSRRDVAGAWHAIDPDNRLLWRQSRLRLDAELIRDAALAASGLLTTEIGGPSVFPPQPEGVMTLGQMRRPWVARHRPEPLPSRPLHLSSGARRRIRS